MPERRTGIDERIKREGLKTIAYTHPGVRSLIDGDRLNVKSFRTGKNYSDNLAQLPRFMYE